MPSGRNPLANTDWVASLSPWPAEGFGLERIRELLARLGDPQRAYRAVHVVGTNGKSTATRTVAAMLAADGLSVGAYTSPHVAGWHERLDTDPAGFERAVERVRADAEAVGATQFETLTAAALADFAAREVDAAVVEAGLGGRLDATNVLDAEVVLLTNVGLEHTDVLGDTREAIAREKLAVGGPNALVVLPDAEWGALVERYVVGGAREAAHAFLGHPPREVEVSLPGRLERRGTELWDGAHNADGARWLAAHAEPADVIVCSILADKDTDGMLAAFATLAPRLVATESSNERALPAGELAGRARAHFTEVEVVAEPAAALARAHELGDSIVVTGSLYLLADLERWPTPATA
jgi:dihydrofolate synthase / folylpolyglutamate synthase